MAAQTGLPAGTPVTYRGGDQPNNAFSLRALQAGEVAANAGTSGVIYGVTDKPVYDAHSRVNTFIHVNHQSNKPRYGVLACVNGTGILNRWLKEQLGKDYSAMNELAGQAQPGANGLLSMPYGNGAERTLKNKYTGAAFLDIDFNRHKLPDMLRAAQEGIVFALNYGFDIMREMGMAPHTVRAGHANMFLSPVFAHTFANVTQTVTELYETDGAQGAAKSRRSRIGFILY